MKEAKSGFVQHISALQFHCAVRQNRKGNCMPKTINIPTGTDWARVKREAAADTRGYPTPPPMAPMTRIKPLPWLLTGRAPTSNVAGAGQP